MWQLIISGPGYFDTAFALPEGVTSVGRADENDIVLSGEAVSRKHARFWLREGGLFLEDLGSRNGLRLNQKQIQGTVPLAPGDVVRMGENLLTVRRPSLAESAPTETFDLQLGVRRLETDLGSTVLLSRAMSESAVLRMLDSVPWDPREIAGNLPPAETSQQPVPYGALLLLYKVAEKLATARTLREFLDDAVDRTMQAVNGLTAVVLLLADDGTLRPLAVRHQGPLRAGEVPVSDAIVQSAISKGEALAVAAAREDQRFSSRESVMLYGVDQVFCFPFGAEGPVTGVLYLNRRSGGEESLEKLFDLCNAIAHLMAVGVARFPGAAQ